MEDNKNQDELKNVEKIKETKPWIIVARHMVAQYLICLFLINRNTSSDIFMQLASGLGSALVVWFSAAIILGLTILFFTSWVKARKILIFTIASWVSLSFILYGMLVRISQ